MNDLFIKKYGINNRCVNFENPTGAKGKAGTQNGGVKGHAAEKLMSGESKVLFDIQGQGVIDYIWTTFKTFDGRVLPSELLRGIRIDMYWDGADKPAVSVPIGDFFGIANGRLGSYETVINSCPGERAFNSYIQMPFLNGAKIIVTNESEVDVRRFFYTVNYRLVELDKDEILYFHSAWRRERRTRLGEEFEILPKVDGMGMFLGTNLGIIKNTLYGDAWWGEGEVNIYLDGDKEFPTLLYTGVEDYIATGWGISAPNHRFHGCLINDPKKNQFCFYRYHIPDPVYFYEGCRVTMEVLGGGLKSYLMTLTKNGVSIHGVRATDRLSNDIKFLEFKPSIQIEDETVADTSYCLFYREDDWCATSYFYLDRPENGLPPLAEYCERVAGLEQKECEKTMELE